jgi:acetate kinase
VALLSGPARTLIVNAGSSSLKIRVLGADDGMVASSDLPPIGTPEAEAGLHQFVRENAPFDAVGHRVVHGGPDFRTSVVVSDDVLDRLRALSELAPLHNPPALAAMDGIRRLVPKPPHVACFDTAFHADLPGKAATYAIPYEWTERWNVRRYGFHGLSHAYAAGRTAEILGRPVAGFRVVTCHLGAGASLAAVAAGRSVDTTMGFTPLEGLVMATRSGSVDPGALLWLQRRVPMPAEVMEEALERKSGLLGISGVSGDMRSVLEAADRGARRAELALDVYLHRLRGGIAAMAAAMDGLDAVTFTGGVGEGSARIRRDACASLGFLGLALDPRRNEVAGKADSDLSASGAQVRVVLVQAREDLEMAREVRRVLATAEAGSSSGTRGEP